MPLDAHILPPLHRPWVSSVAPILPRPGAPAPWTPTPLPHRALRQLSQTLDMRTTSLYHIHGLCDLLLAFHLQDDRRAPSMQILPHQHNLQPSHCSTQGNRIWIDLVPKVGGRPSSGHMQRHDLSALDSIVPENNRQNGAMQSPCPCFDIARSLT